MTVEEIRKTTTDFLNTLDKQNLIKFNSILWRNKFTKNYACRTPIYLDTLHKIIEKTDEGKLGIRASNEAINIFIFMNIVYFIVSGLEYIKKLLNVLIDKEKISFSNNITYGKLLVILCDKLKYTETQKKSILDNFFLNFRNAISHIQYSITNTGVSVEIDDRTIHYDIKALNQIVNEVTTIFNVFDEFANKKSLELENESIKLEKKAADLQKQANEVQRKNMEMRKKLNR